MKKCFGLMILFFLLTVVGCVRVDYVGQKFPALSEGEYVDFYRNLNEVPSDLKPIGRGTVLVPMSMIDDDIYLLFSEKAAEIGASAFAISGSEKVLVGVTDEVESRPTRPDGNWSVDGTDSTGRSVYSNTFGREEELNVVRKTHYKLKLTAVFYVPIEVYNEYITAVDSSNANQNIEEQKDQEN